MYHQYVHLLDLCTLSYQLHSQTLIWPMDPYYEQWSLDSDLRNRFMAKVRQLAATAKYRGYRGPGSLMGVDIEPRPRSYHFRLFSNQPMAAQYYKA